MTRHLVRVLLFSLSLPLLAPPLALAQSRAEPTSELDAQVTQGIALRRSGRDREALEMFLRAEALAPRSARVQVHLAGTYQALGEWLRADEYMRRALAQGSDPFVQRHQDTLQLAQRTIDEHIGVIELDGSPSGAEVRIDGQPQGTLPLSRPIRAPAGSYTLELKRAGYYPARRHITVVGGTLTREVLHLSVDTTATPAAPSATAGVELRQPWSSSASWLPWALGGLGAAAVGVSTLAWISRERHAERWNDDDRCQRQGLTREDVCSSERLASERAETVLLVSSLAAGAFAAGAVVSIVLGEQAAEEAEQARLDCGLKGVGLACLGQF
jgi:hypothetical protein